MTPTLVKGRSSFLLLAIALLALLTFVACGSASSSGSSSSASSSSSSQTSSDQSSSPDATATAQEKTLLQDMTIVGTPAVKVTGSSYKVTGSIKNGDSKKHDIYVQATLMDGSGKQVATSTVFKVEDLDGGDTGQFNIEGTGAPSSPGTLTAHVSVVKVDLSY